MDVSPLDRGDFTCIASNAYGQDRATFQLIVQGNLTDDRANFCYYPVIKLNAFLSITAEGNLVCGGGGACIPGTLIDE
jgi:hypothetical protein